jgi:site-specific recombinase XerD
MSRREGLRDVALLALLYNTGARASEAAGVRLEDLSLETSPTVRLRCKGRHERRCPLWPSTAAILRRYRDECRGPESPDRCLFLNQRGQQLTRHGIGRRVARYIALAARHLPSLRSKRLSVHSFRHTTAVHLLESGADMHVIKTWLGHRSSRSTDHYLDLNLQAQRDLLARFSPPPLLDRLTDPGETDPDDWLNQL